MKAIVLKSFGGPESFELRRAQARAAGGAVLVRVHATSINPLDYQVRRGDYRSGALAGHHRPRCLGRDRGCRGWGDGLRAGR